LAILTLLLFSINSNAQGCVAIRSSCGVGGSGGNGSILKKGELLVATNFRYFESYKHFRGKHEETERVELGTEVINTSYFADLTLNYGITNRWYGTLTVPMAYHLRSSMYEHGGNPPNGKGERHETSSMGLSDIRFGGGFWLFDPTKKERFNYAIGLGVKLPTGDYNVTDEFYNQGATKDSVKVQVVDQSIQLGDGGYGITLDIQGFQSITKNLLVTTNLYYMSNPMMDNGVLTRSGTQYFSCPDQYAARLGLSYITPVKGLVFSLGGRWEGVPSEDLIGSSQGYRRPGYVISVDPGITYVRNNFVCNVGVPVAVERNRVQSYQDKLVTQNSGTFTQGDAAFADYVINVSFAYKFFSKSNVHVEMPVE
jgi:hypothetical protein